MAQPNQPTAIVLAIQGLVLNPSTFDPKTSNGALTVANNVVIDRPNVVQSRRGFANPAPGIINPGGTGASPSAKSFMQYSNSLLAHGYDEKLYIDYSNQAYESVSGYIPSFVELGTFLAPIQFVNDGLVITESYEPRIRGIEVNKNLYFITENGTYRLDAPGNSPRKAGSPPGLGGTAVTLGTTGFLANNTQVAYRIVFGFKDENKQLVLGAPSSRIILSNSSGTATNATVTFQVPDEIQASPTSYFFQVYRGHASPDLTTEPDDEMALAYEEVFTAAVASVTIDDITPNDLLGAALYTNQGQDGILQSNYRPPWAVDICTFKQYAFYANTRTKMNANLTLISAGALNGANALVPGDIVTFTHTSGSFTLTAAAANNAATGDFAVSNTGNPALDIQVTASNLVNIANTYGNNTFLDAYYTSTGSDLPGQMQFVYAGLTDQFSIDAFSIASSNINPWEQPINTASGTTPLISENETRPNRIYFSKFNQPEAVPIVNYFDVGSANAPIRRIVPLRDGVMVMKDDGVFRISNFTAPFTITPIDYNVKILAANTAAELDNKVYFLSDQGIVALSDTDAQIMSFVLDKTIIENTSPTLYPNLRDVAWGVAYQSDRKYILTMPTNVDPLNQQVKQYVYNHLTQCWTNWDIQAMCGIVFKKDGRLYLGKDEVFQERKSFTNNDYADSRYYALADTASGFNLTVTYDVSAPLPDGLTIGAGWTVEQYTNNNTYTATIVTATSNTEFILDSEQPWELGSPVYIYVPISTEVETIQIDCDNPGMNKQFTEMIYIFTTQDFSSIDVAISSNTTAMPEYDTLVPLQRGGWGVTPWGPTPWGTGITGQGKVRRYIPQNMQRAGWIYLNLQNAECFTSFGWSGFELYYKQTSSRQK